MGRQSLLWLVWIMLLVVGGCATGQPNGKPAGAVGMREAELIAEKGCRNRSFLRLRVGRSSSMKIAAWIRWRSWGAEPGINPNRLITG